MNIVNVSEIPYNDLETLRNVLVGQTIEEITYLSMDNEDEWSEIKELLHIFFKLSNGMELEAIETDGGCACSNGCWSVKSEATVGSTIMGVEIEERDNYTGELFTSDVYEGSATIKLFVLTDAGKQGLVVSSGEDNGYYGWGFHLRVHEPAF